MTDLELQRRVLAYRYGFTEKELNRMDVEVVFVMWRWIVQHGANDNG